MAIRIENDGVAGLVSNKDYQVDDVPPDEVEPDTGSEFLADSILTTPQSKPTSHLLIHSTWGMSRGRGIRRKERNQFILVPEGGICSQSADTNSPFHPRSSDRKKEPNLWPGFEVETPVVGRNVYWSQRNANDAEDSSLRNVLELIFRRLDNFMQRKYFPSLSDSFLVAGSDAKTAARAASKSAVCADVASKSTAAAAAACQSAVVEAAKLVVGRPNVADCASNFVAGGASNFVVGCASNFVAPSNFVAGRKNVAGIKNVAPSYLVAGSTSKTVAGNASYITAPCHATPERIESYYNVAHVSQQFRSNVLTCIATTRIQNTLYPILSSYGPKQQLFGDSNTNVSYINTEQSPCYDTLATKNWTVVTTTFSNSQFTPIGSKNFVEVDRQRKPIIYSHYPRSDLSVYAVSERGTNITN